MSERSPLHVERRGAEHPPGSETFLLVHGFGASSYTWRHWVPALKRRGRVLLVDLKGFGGADKPDDGRYAPDDQAALLLDLVEREDLGRLTLVGHSYGGGVAMLTALALVERGDRRLERLIVVAGAAYRQRLPPFVGLANHPFLTEVALTILRPERVMRHVLRSIVVDASTVDEGQVRAYSASLRSHAGVRGLLDAARQIVPHDLDELTARYPTIDVPALLVWGDRDRVVPLAIGRRLADDLPSARLAVLEGCGHVPQEERPEESLALLEAFLDTESAAAAR